MSLFFSSVRAQLQWGHYDLELGGSVSTVYTDTINDLLYVGGKFGTANGDTTSCIAVYDGNQWKPIGSTYVVGWLWSIVVYHDTLFIGGHQPLPGGLKKWDGSNWISVGGSEVYGQVYDLEVIDDELWVAGNFDSIGSMPAHGLARWNGSEWKTAYDFPKLDSTDINWIVEVTRYKEHIYIGGNMGSDEYSEMAMWNGEEWTDVGGGIKRDGFSGVNRMIEYKGDLYVLGSFLTATGNADNNIMRWNGEKWLRCGGGTEKRIYDGVVYKDKLWVTEGGHSAGGVETDGLAVWDGEQWCSPGNVFSYNGNAAGGWPGGIGVYRDTLVLGGGFTEIDGEDYSRMAYWTGVGNFDSCGVLWPLGIEEEQTIIHDDINIFPNPTSNHVTITSHSVMDQVDLYNSRGILVKHHVGSNAKMIDIQLEGLQNGLYFLRIMTEKKAVTKKIVKTN